MRGAGPGAPRTMAFHGERLSVEIEIDEAGIVGQLTPPQPGHVTLMTADGPQATVEADEVGCFTFPPPAAGSLRLDCRMGAERFITEWVTVYRPSSPGRSFLSTRRAPPAGHCYTAVSSGDRLASWHSRRSRLNARCRVGPMLPTGTPRRWESSR